MEWFFLCFGIVLIIAGCFIPILEKDKEGGIVVKLILSLMGIVLCMALWHSIVMGQVKPPKGRLITRNFWQTKMIMWDENKDIVKRYELRYVEKGR